MAEEDTNHDRAQAILSCASLMEQLLTFEKFVDFITLHFDLLKNTDPDTGQVSWVVDEKDPKIVHQLLMEKMGNKEQPKIELAGADILEKLKKGDIN